MSPSKIANQKALRSGTGLEVSAKEVSVPTGARLAIGIRYCSDWTVVLDVSQAVSLNVRSDLVIWVRIGEVRPHGVNSWESSSKPWTRPSSEMQPSGFQAAAGW